MADGLRLIGAVEAHVHVKFPPARQHFRRWIPIGPSCLVVDHGEAVPKEVLGANTDGKADGNPVALQQIDVATAGIDNDGAAGSGEGYVATLRAKAG